MTTEQKHEIINQVASEHNLFPYQIEILNKILEMDKGRVFIVLPRLSGRTMLKRSYYEIIKRLNEEELK